LPFDAASMRRIHALSRGVPRRINLLCDRALLGAYASGTPQVDAAIVDKAAAEVGGETPPRRWGSHSRSTRKRIAAALGLGIVAGAALFGAGLWVFDTLRASTPAQQQAGR
jgi:general secretion pathway protein A